MKKGNFPVVPKEPTPFKMMCDEHEVGYMDIAKSSGVSYHIIAKIATHAAKPTDETLAKLNQVCEPIFGKTLTLEDFGFHPEPQEPAEVSAGSTEPLIAEPKPAKKKKQKKASRTKVKNAGTGNNEEAKVVQSEPPLSVEEIAKAVKLYRELKKLGIQIQ